MLSISERASSMIKMIPRISAESAQMGFRTSLLFGLPENQAMLPGKVADVFFENETSSF
jgi:hypothetical protein